jgi:hypothetical protein
MYSTIDVERKYIEILKVTAKLILAVARLDMNSANVL